MSEPGAVARITGKVIVGLTGNIATGKSAVMRLAAEHGALAIDADRIVHEIMDQDASMQAAIAVAFGSDVRREDGRIDRTALGKIVFADPAALRDLEMMLHPAVRLEIARRIQEGRASVVFIEAIKLLESSLAEACHQVWVTRCSSRQQLERLRVCRGLDQETAVARIRAQPPQEEKVARADVVIDTGGLMRNTEMQFDLAWERLPEPDSLAERLIPHVAAPAAVQTTRPEPAVLDAAAELAETASPAVGDEEPPAARPAHIEVRRARPSDIPSILLLMQKATAGAVKRKRADLLASLGDRSYFIGQIGADISAVMGWNIENLVGRIDEIFIHPLAAARETGLAVLDEIEESAQRHICEVVVAFLSLQAPPAYRQLFEMRGYRPIGLEKMPRDWRIAIQESRQEGSTFLVKVLRERVTHPI